MSILKNPEAKQLYIMLALLTAVFLCLAFLLSRLELYLLKESIVENISAAIGAAAQKYPEAEADILLQLKEAGGESINFGKDLLKKYGYHSDNILTEVGSLQRFTYINGILTVLFSASLCMALVIVFTIFMKNQYKRIREVTEYAKLVQSQDYTLDIRDNSEGDISILKNEIYKITTLLREQAEALRADKIKLSDSIADISHQLKTPLTSLIVLNDLLSGDPDPQTRQEFLHRAESQLERMQWLVSSLLKLSKLEAGTVVMKKELVSARSLIEKALEPLMVQIDSKQLNVIIGNDSCNKTQSADMNEINGSDHCAVDDVSFTGDFNWTLEAVTNIIKNCVEHTPNGGQIFISYDDNPIYTSIVISDNGKGIHKSDLPFIFQRFYKGRNAGDDSVGIGLAMAKAIINEQNGDITVDSELGKGTAFSIKFYKSS